MHLRPPVPFLVSHLDNPEHGGSMDMSIKGLDVYFWREGGQDFRKTSEIKRAISIVAFQAARDHWYFYVKSPISPWSHFLVKVTWTPPIWHASIYPYPIRHSP